MKKWADPRKAGYSHREFRWGYRTPRLRSGWVAEVYSAAELKTYGVYDTRRAPVPEYVDGRRSVDTGATPEEYLRRKAEKIRDPRRGLRKIETEF